MTPLATAPSPSKLEGLDPSDPLSTITQLVAHDGEFIGGKGSKGSKGSNSGSMTGADNLLNLCRDKGIRLHVEDGRLLYEAPPGAIDDAIRPRLKAQKAALIALLTPEEPFTPPVPPSATPDLPPSPPDPLDKLKGPRRTPWGTLAWSDPTAPALELFGPC